MSGGAKSWAVWLVVMGVVLVAPTTLGKAALLLALGVWLLAKLVGRIELARLARRELPALSPRTAPPEPGLAPDPKVESSRLAAASVRVERAGAARDCPLCHEPLAGALPQRSCARCETPHHEPCWEELGGCAVLGCRGPDRREVAA